MSDDLRAKVNRLELEIRALGYEFKIIYKLFQSKQVHCAFLQAENERLTKERDNALAHSSNRGSGNAGGDVSEPGGDTLLPTDRTQILY